MTRDEIMSMDEDALQFAIAVRLSDDSVEVGGVVYMHSKPALDWPRDIAAAWNLMEEMRAAELNVTIYHAVGIDGWIVSLDYMNSVAYYGETAPLAICRAWLMWKEAK